MGFGANVVQKGQYSTGELLKKVQPEDLIKFGLIPEFLGRLPVVATLHELSEETLVRILTEPRHALVSQFRRMFELDDAELAFTPGALEAIAQKAIGRLQRSVGQRNRSGPVSRCGSSSRFISGWVTVRGFPSSICFLKRGITLPLDPSTLPKRADVKIGPAVRSVLLAAVIKRSPISLEVPMTLVGLTALSSASCSWPA